MSRIDETIALVERHYEEQGKACRRHFWEVVQGDAICRLCGVARSDISPETAEELLRYLTRMGELHMHRNFNAPQRWEHVIRRSSLCETERCMKLALWT